MAGRIIGFIMWGLVGLLFVCLGIYSFFSKKPMGFWANAEMFEVTDLKKYNSAVAKLYCAFGFVFILLGLPLLSDNAALILLSTLGVMLEVIVIMVIYVTVIERKYRKK